MKRWILAALVAAFVAVPVSASAQQADQTSGRSLAYRIEFDDVRDRLVHYELFPGLVYFGRGITLGFGVGVDLQLLSWLQLQLYGQGAYTGFIADPNGPLLAEAVLALGGPSVEKKPTAVELTRSSDFQRLNSTQGLVTTYTQNLSGVPLSERTRSPFRLGV